MDSDFDIDENDEVKSDIEDGEESKRKKKGVSTKAYKVSTTYLYVVELLPFDVYL